MVITISLPNELVNATDRSVNYQDPKKKNRSKVIALALQEWLKNQKRVA